MWKDPIVEEVRKIRNRLAKQFNYDLRAIIEDARQRQYNSGGKVVSPPGRKAEPNRKAG